MKQLAKFKSFLIVSEIPLGGAQEFDAAILPEGAEVLSVSVEVTEPSTSAASASVGLAGAESFFIRGISLINPGEHSESAIKATIKATQPLKIKLDANTNDGRIKVRVHFFAPSEILFEA